MRLLLAALLISSVSFGQKQVADTTINDSTALIQARYFDYFIGKVKDKVSDKLTLKEWDELMALASQVVNQSAADLRRRQTKSK